MKRIALMFMLMSVTFVMVATTAHRTEMVKARGQPHYEVSINAYTPEIVCIEIAVVNSEVYVTETLSLMVAISSNTESVPEITTGVRKVRDVDMCSCGNLYTNRNTDKRSALTNKTVRLPRGSVSCWKLC